MVKRLLAILVIVSTSFLPLSGQVASPRCTECEAHLDDSVNPIVVREALNSINSLTLKIQAGTASVEDVGSTITASKTLFAHLREKGFYTVLDSTLMDMKQPILEAELMKQLSNLSAQITEPERVLPIHKHCRNYSIAAAAYGVCCALGGIPCCILAAIAGLFATLCEAGFDV